jgi:hypothetical protein
VGGGQAPKLRVKVSGSLHSLGGVQDFAAIISYTATAIRAGKNMLYVLVEAAAGTPWISKVIEVVRTTHPDIMAVPRAGSHYRG